MPLESCPSRAEVSGRNHHHGLLFRSTPVPSPEVTQISFVDDEWGNDTMDRKSVSGHYLLLNNNPIVRSSKRQYVISRSS